MSHRKQIEGKIREAMLQACDDMLAFCDEPSRELFAEYLLTVNVAKAIARLNCYYADPYKVFLERSTRVFARECLRPVLFGSPVRNKQSQILKSRPKIDRNGRIDIAVYAEEPNSGYFGAQPICAIELKAFNPARKLVVKDLKRNLEFLRIAGNTGPSVLCFASLAALHSFSKVANVADLEKNVDETKRKYEGWLSELSPIPDMEVHTQAFTVRKEMLGRVVDEGEYEALDADTRHHFVGAIVTFSRRQPEPLGNEHAGNQNFVSI